MSPLFFFSFIPVFFKPSSSIQVPSVEPLPYSDHSFIDLSSLFADLFPDISKLLSHDHPGACAPPLLLILV